MKTAAKIISFVFHPLLLATYLTLTIGLFFPAMLMMDPSKLIALSLFIFGFTFGMPALYLLLLRFFKNIRSLHLESQHERKQPFIFISVLYIIIAYLFIVKFPFNSNFNKLLMIIAALVVVATVLTFFMKVSVHSLGMGGWVGILLPLIRFSPSLLWPTAILIVITGVVITSRLLLNSHTLRETIIGSVAGLLVGYSGMILLF